MLALIPFFRVGFTTGDDIESYLIRLQGFSYWLTDAASYAKEQGRFYFYLNPLGNIPYLIDNFYFTKIVQYVSLLSAYGVFVYFVFRIFRSRVLSLVLLLALIVWTQITFNHHIPTIAYPFSFCFSFILCLSACLLFIRYTETMRYRMVIYSALLFFITFCFYENYLLFLGVFGLYVLVRNIRMRSLKKVFKTPQLYKEIVPYLLSGLVYIVIYLSFQHFYSPNYTGTLIAESFSFSHFCQILWHCTTVVLPALNFFRELPILTFGHPGGLIAHIGYALTHAPIRVYMEAVAACILFVYYIRREDVKIPYSKLIAGIVISIVLSFFFHSLIGITEKYNADWYKWMRGYTTSFYAIFGITLAILLSLFAILQKIKPYKWLYRTIVTGASTLMFATIILTGYANEYISRDWQRSQNRFFLLDELAAGGYFENIEENSIFYGADLQNPCYSAAQITKADHIIGRYIQIKSGRSYFYESCPEDLYKTAAQHPSAHIYRLNIKEPDENYGMILSVSDVGTVENLQNQAIDSIPALSADHFYYAPRGGFNLQQK